MAHPSMRRGRSKEGHTNRIAESNSKENLQSPETTSSAPRVTRCITLVAYILSAFSVVLFVYYNFLELEEDEKQHIRLPQDLDDAKALGKILWRWRDKNYYQVLTGLFCIYVLFQTFAIQSCLSLSIPSGFLNYLSSFIVASNCYLSSHLAGVKQNQMWIPGRLKKWSTASSFIVASNCYLSSHLAGVKQNQMWIPGRLKKWSTASSFIVASNCYLSSHLAGVKQNQMWIPGRLKKWSTASSFIVASNCYLSSHLAGVKQNQMWIPGRLKKWSTASSFIVASNCYLSSHLAGVKQNQMWIPGRLKKWSTASSFIVASNCYLSSHLAGVKQNQMWIPGRLKKWSTAVNNGGRWGSWFMSKLCRALVTGLLILPVVTASGCRENQTAELGRQGLISCNFPDDFDTVYWFDNVSDSSHHVIKYKPEEGVTGPGYESGDYDVFQNGSLIIVNVTTSHERVFRVVISRTITPDIFNISLKVTAPPGDRFPVIECDNCHRGYYYSMMGSGMTINCSFNVARPPVQLEWLQQYPYENSRVEIQETKIIQNRNGTFNSLATVDLFKDDEKLINLLLCRASWPPSEWQREKEILVDFSQNNSFISVPQKVFHMEINKYAKIQCREPSSAYFVWKRIFANNEPQIIGYHSHVMTETITDTPDIEVSAEGSLVFSSPQVHHEGTYACIYRDGQKEEIQMTSVEILIPPSPPYIQIVGCDDVSHSCVLKENSTKKLTCAVYGVRPNATLEWIAEDMDQISFFSHKEVFKGRGDTFDIIRSVEYKVSPDVLCGEEILIRCHLHGPLSKIMKAEVTALVTPASCMENEVKGETGFGGVVVVVLVYTLILISLAITLLLLYRTNSRRKAQRKCNDVAVLYVGDCQETSAYII